MIPLEEAQQFVLGHCDPLPPAAVALSDALGCVLGHQVVATEPVPPFANSSMDGYAVRSADTTSAPVTLTVVGSIMAGHPFPGTVGPGQAARIMTGAPLPKGADAVCMVEETTVEPDGSRVTLARALPAGNFVRPPGRDVAVGDVIAPAGTVLTPAYLGVLANQGTETVMVHPRPRVGVLSTGDELYSGPGPLPPAKIRDANRQSLLALVHAQGWEGIDLGIVGDNEAELIEVLHQGAARCDAVITSGGVSVGDLDLVRVVLEKLSGGRMRWMQVAIRPAKPFAFGRLADSGLPVFGLPGNPVSALVSFELFVRPALRALAGHRVLHRPVVNATCATDLERQPDGKTHFLRARVALHHDGTWGVQPSLGQESHQLHAMAEANALVMLPDGAGAPAGDQVAVLLIDPDRLQDDASPALAGLHR
ncbi:MAG TPA: gephyrin-like molybdotransferase Glp [Acidimicrobiales bacterium]